MVGKEGGREEGRKPAAVLNHVQHGRKLATVCRAEVHAARPAKAVAELLTDLPHRRRVHERRKLLDVVEQSLLNISLDLNTSTILFVLSGGRSTTKLLLELGAQSLEVFDVILPTGHQALDLLSSTLQFIYVDYA